MKSFILTITAFLFINLSTLHAQFAIKGKIVDRKGDGIAFANILLLNKSDSTMYKGTIATELGQYAFESIPTGDYLLLSSFVGYQKSYSSRFYLDKNIDLEALKLEEGSNLNEIEVKESKPLYEKKIDRTIINVSSSIVSVGSTALEILERSPGVILNRQSNAISLVGKEGVVIMINGKISYMPISAVIALLQGMSATNIESIELITSPPSNLDAEGNAGFINIVLKKRTDQGLNGNVSVSAGFGIGFGSKENLDFNYRKNKLNVFGSYSYLLVNSLNYMTFNRDYTKENSEILKQTTSRRDASRSVHNFRLGADYEISKNTIIGVLLNAYTNLWSMDAFNNGSTTANKVADSFVEIANIETNKWKHIGSNFNLSHKISDKSNFSFDIDYLVYDNNNPINYENSSFNQSHALNSKWLTKSSKVTPLKTWVSKLDFHQNLSQKLNFDYGVKATINHFENAVAVTNFENNVWRPDPSLTDKSILDEIIWAAYSSFDYNLNPKTTMKAGLRYEHTDTVLDTEKKGRVVDRNYGRFFPTVYLNHKVKENLNLNVSYSKRITRPTFNDLAPFVILVDANTFISGNAALQPAISNSFKFDLSYKSTIFSLDYSRQKSAIGSFQQRYDVTNDRFVFEASNLDYLHSFSATLGFPVTVNNWWRMTNNLIGIFQKVKINLYASPMVFDLYTYNLNTTQNFKISQKVSAEVSAFYSGPSFFGAARVNSFYGVNLGTQYKLKKGTLSFALTDLFDSVVFNTGIDVPSEQFKTFNKLDFSNRNFMFTYSTNFGSKGIKSSRGNQGGAAEERSRVN